MASIRTARILAAVAAVPLTLGVLGGAAHAAGKGGKGGADDYTIGGIVSQAADSSVRSRSGNASTTQQAAIGDGASNRSNTANVNGVLYGPLVQSTDPGAITLNFGPGMR